MTTPTTKVWIATFIALVFSIGLMAGVVIERLVLHPAESRVGRGPGEGRIGGPGGRGRGGGPGGPGGLAGPVGPDGPGGPGGPGGPRFGPPPSQYVNELSAQVQLSDQQRADILALLQAQETRLGELQTEARRMFIEEQQALHERIAALLTPEQAETFKTWVARRTGQNGRGRR